MHPRTGRRLLAGVGAAYAATWLVNRSLRRVEGQSMTPGLWPDDLLLTVPARALRLRRGDIVVADTPRGRVTKRVVGLPGEDVLLQDGHLHVDGVWYAEPYAVPVDEEWRWRLGDDEVLVLGDHRGASTDGREFGPLPTAALDRVALARVRPWARLRGAGGPAVIDGPRRRPTVRVMVFDPDDRLLLFRVRDKDGTEATWWETPGGGIEEGEPVLAAARRELAEEVGHTGLLIAPLDRVDERAASARGAELVKVESYATTRLSSADLDTSGWTDAEVRNHLEVRWFDLDDLRDLDLPAVPDDVAAYAPEALDALRAAEAADAS